MIRSLRGGAGTLDAAGSAAPDEDLPYVIELWDLARRKVERVLGRASSATLARAIFAAAQSEHLGRRITLRRGTELMGESG